MPFIWVVCAFAVLEVLVQDCRVGKYSKTSVGAGTWWSHQPRLCLLPWWFWLLISDFDAYYLMIWSLWQLSVWTGIQWLHPLWCSLELVVCTSESLDFFLKHITWFMVPANLHAIFMESDLVFCSQYIQKARSKWWKILWSQTRVLLSYPKFV